MVDDEALDKCIEELTSTKQEASELFAPKRRTCADPLTPVSHKYSG
jgi:hypothetical protein